MKTARFLILTLTLGGTAAFADPFGSQALAPVPVGILRDSLTNPHTRPYWSRILDPFYEVASVPVEQPQGPPPQIIDVFSDLDNRVDILNSILYFGGWTDAFGGQVVRNHGEIADLGDSIGVELLNSADPVLDRLAVFDRLTEIQAQGQTRGVRVTRIMGNHDWFHYRQTPESNLGEKPIPGLAERIKKAVQDRLIVAAAILGDRIASHAGVNIAIPPLLGYKNLNSIEGIQDEVIMEKMRIIAAHMNEILMSAVSGDVPMPVLNLLQGGVVGLFTWWAKNGTQDFATSFPLLLGHMAGLKDTKISLRDFWGLAIMTDMGAAAGNIGWVRMVWHPGQKYPDTFAIHLKSPDGYLVEELVPLLSPSKHGRLAEFRPLATIQPRTLAHRAA